MHNGRFPLFATDRVLGGCYTPHRRGGPDQKHVPAGATAKRSWAV